jgi:hypothetical protein
MRKLALVAAAGAALLTASAAATLLPQRSVTAPGRVLTLGLTGRHAAFAVGTTPRECPHVQLWLTESGARYRFRSTLRGCKEGPSTGFGLPAVAVARTRVVWLTYIGGNLRDWILWTATPTRHGPRMLRFVERDVDAPAPIVLGPGTAEGIPYAVDRNIVYLGEDGRAIFRATVASPVRLLASHRSGRFGTVVAALLADGTVVGLDRHGEQEIAFQPAGTVTALALDSTSGIAHQGGSEVRFTGGSVRLPAGARMVDFAQGRVLWVRAGDLGTTTVVGQTVRLVDGTTTRPAYGQLEPAGLAWSRGPALSWRAGSLPR